MKKLLIGSAIAIAVTGGAAGAVYKSYNPQPTSVPITIVAKTKHSASKPQPQFHIGDTQMYKNLSITLTGFTGVAYMGNIPAGDKVVEARLQVTNNGNVPYNGQDGFTTLSSVYTQVGTDTSTGAYESGIPDACYAGLISPGQTVTVCVRFVVPTNALVDTYFYDNLKWFL